MTVDQVITKAYLHAKRKATAPATGTTKYNALLAIADSMQQLWATEPDTDWNTLYDLAPLGATVSATDTFALPATVNYLSKRADDYIQISSGTTTSYYRLVQPDQLHRYKDSQVCAQIGRNLVFPVPFSAASTLIGYTINVPAYLYCNQITSGSDTVQVDDPMWLAYSMAAEFIRTDATLQNQYDNLLALADQCMTKMKQANGGQMDEVARDWQPAGESWV